MMRNIDRNSESLFFHYESTMYAEPWQKIDRCREDYTITLMLHRFEDAVNGEPDKCIGTIKATLYNFALVQHLHLTRAPVDDLMNEHSKLWAAGYFLPNTKLCLSEEWKYMTGDNHNLLTIESVSFDKEWNTKALQMLLVDNIWGRFCTDCGIIAVNPSIEFDKNILLSLGFKKYKEGDSLYFLITSQYPDPFMVSPLD